jgi:hypothetical protein
MMESLDTSKEKKGFQDDDEEDGAEVLFLGEL